jgi:microcompartment protein CcmL/EutN
MAYTDPRVTHEFVALAGGAVEVEAAADILAKVGRVADVGTGTDAILDSVLFPAGGVIDAFGVEITEALTNANATKCIVALKVLDKPGGTTTTVATITLPGSSADVTVSTQTNPSSATATQAVAAGARLLSSDSDIPYRVPQGGLAYLEVTQAAGAAGGAFKAFIQARQDGTPGGTSASPVTKISS